MTLFFLALFFDFADKTYNSCHEMTLKTCGSHIKSSEWLRNKKATVNTKNDNDEYILNLSTYWDLYLKNLNLHLENQ